MITAFTICANNYLAHAKTLERSFKKQHPEVHFIIAILDEPNDAINYNDLDADEILWIPKLFSGLVNTLKNTYGIAELCTVVKPELFRYLYNKENDIVLYIDPDIKVFSKFTEVFTALKNNNVVLTPHLCSPTGDVGHPIDKDIMRTGVYNLGFLAMKKTKETLAFVDWWDKRVKAYGFHDLKKGYFYDQIWLGFAPAFLDKVYILRDLGYNVANWNLHERKIIKKEEQYFINDLKTPIKFFHYSHYKMENEPDIASYNQNFNLENRPDLIPIFNEYKMDLKASGYQFLKEIAYQFGKTNPPVIIKKESRFSKSKKLFKKALRVLILGK